MTYVIIGGQYFPVSLFTISTEHVVDEIAGQYEECRTWIFFGL